jgi:hypothetical protein
MNNIRQFIYKSRDAIVLISGFFIENNTLHTKKGNGFFIKGHYIICPSSLILNKTVIANKILIEVPNVNGDGLSYSYNAYIIGYDGIANISILKVRNDTTPLLKICHPFLLWGKSRNSCSGDNILLIGDTVGNHHSENGICCGYVSDNRYVCPNGIITGELLLLDVKITDNNQCGLPVLDSEGNIIGMYIGKSLAISEFFMRRPVKNIIMAYQERIIKNNLNDSLKFVDSDFKYIKSWLGVKAIISCQDDYETIINSNLERQLMENNKVISRDITGYRIIDILDISPIYNKIQNGDIITHINACPLGDRKGQVSPSLVLWRVYPGDNITIMYKKQEEMFENVHQLEVQTLKLDSERDYPHNDLSYVTI